MDDVLSPWDVISQELKTIFNGQAVKVEANLKNRLFQFGKLEWNLLSEDEVELLAPEQVCHYFSVCISGLTDLFYKRPELMEAFADFNDVYRKIIAFPSSLQDAVMIKCI